MRWRSRILLVLGAPALLASSCVAAQDFPAPGKPITSGPGSASHLCGMLFQSTLKVDMISVPYKGTAPSLKDTPTLQEAGGASVITDNRVDPAGHKAFVLAELAKWAPVIRASGVYAD